MNNYYYLILAVVILPLGPISKSIAEPQELISSPTKTTTSEDLMGEIPQQESTIEIRGLIKPLREAILSTDVITKIESIDAKNGDYFKKGDELITFYCDRQRAELRAVESETKSRKMIYRNNKELLKFDAVATLELEISKAQYEKALAELNVIRVRNQECTIKAPWNGRVTAVNAHALEIIEPGREIMKILDDSSLEIEMIVPSNWLSWIEPGINCPITIDENEEDYEIEISRVGARVDPVSQTVHVFANFKQGTADNVLAGMSGTVYFNPPN